MRIVERKFAFRQPAKKTPIDRLHHVFRVYAFANAHRKLAAGQLQKSPRMASRPTRLPRVLAGQNVRQPVRHEQHFELLS